MSDSSVSSTDRKVGSVKWFNNKAGYGFITVGENTDSPTDVFVHYSNINVSNSQYKYLVQGEYVEFIQTPTPDGPHAFQATAVTGIQGGPTLCDRRRLTRESSLDDDEAPPVRRQQRPRPPASDDKPRPSRAPANRKPVAPKDTKDVDEEGFKTVKKRKPVVQK
jgi:CspA family cold shock protein